MTYCDELMIRIQWLTIFAILLGPIIAIQVQKFIETRTETRNRKLWIFRTLMATRGTPLAPEHVTALNMIDIEFYKGNKNEEKAVESWKIYLNHLCEAPKDTKDPNYNSNFAVWNGKITDLLVNLLYDLSIALGYKFDKVLLRKGAYRPQGHGDLELEQMLLRRGLLEMLAGKLPLNIKITNEPKS